MGLFDFLKADPSKEWPPHRGEALLLDLVAFSLNGVKLDAPATELERFGQPDNRRPFRTGVFNYEASGMTINIHSEQVGYFGLPVIKVELVDEVGPCDLSVLFPDGVKLRIPDGTPTSEMLSHLPDPAEVDRDETETVRTFTLGEFVLELESSPDDVVRRVNLFRDDIWK